MWGYKLLILSLLSPLFMWSLFNGQAKGDLTNSVQLATKKYGKDPAYEEYIGSTPLIVPTSITSWFKTLFSLSKKSIN
jgi:hypothetical protein